MESNPGTPVVLPELDPANDATDFVKDARLANATPEERIVLLSCAPDKLVGVFKRFVRRHGPYNYTEYRLGPDATSRLLCVVPTHGGSLHYDGEWGTEYRVACWDATGHAKWYEGPRGMEALSREASVDGQSMCYKGTMGSEHVTGIYWPNGDIHVYDGPKDHEHLVQIGKADGWLTEFRGGKGEEAMHRRRDPEGESCEYAGPQGEERLISRSDSSGTKHAAFAGPRNRERLIRLRTTQYDADGKLYDTIETLYDGPRHKERVLFKLHNWGDEASQDHLPQITYFKGGKGHERMVGIAIVKPSAWCNYQGKTPKSLDKMTVDDLIERRDFEGERGRERLVSIESDWIEDWSHRVRLYAGDAGRERLVRTCDHLSGCHEYYRGEAGEEVLYKTILNNGSVIMHGNDGGPDAKAAAGRSTKKKKRQQQQQQPKPKPKPKPRPAQETDAEAARRAAVRKRWRSAAWRAVRLERALAEATRANAEAAARQAAVREQCDAARAARSERAYTTSGPSHREGAPTWFAGEAPDARDEAKRAAEKDASRAAAAEAKAARRAAIARSMRQYLEKARLLRVAEAIGGSK